METLPFYMTALQQSGISVKKNLLGWGFQLQLR